MVIKILIGVLAVLILGAGYAVNDFASSPVSGAPTKSNKKISRDTGTSDPAPKPSALSENNYYVLNLPPGFNVQPARTDPPVLLRQNIIKADTQGSYIIAISLTNQLESLENDPSFRLRSSQPDRFARAYLNIDGETIVMMTGQTSGGVAGFWLRNGYLAVIGVSSGLDRGSETASTTEREILATVIKAIQWR